MCSRSEAACECGSRTMISARSGVLLEVLRGGDWLGFCCLVGVMFQDLMDIIWLIEKRDVWRCSTAGGLALG